MVAPENVSVETLNASTKVVRWQALSPCDWSGEPKGYVVRWTLTFDLDRLALLHLSGQSPPVVPSQRLLQVAVTDLTTSSEVRQMVSWRHQTVYIVLRRGRSYNVSISAVNSEGVGPPSIPVTFTVTKGGACLFITCPVSSWGFQEWEGTN